MTQINFTLTIKDLKVPDRYITFQLRVDGYKTLIETDTIKMKRKIIVGSCSADYENHIIKDRIKIEKWIHNNWHTIDAIFYEKLYSNKK